MLAIVELSNAWVLAAIGTLCGTIATLASALWCFMKSRLEAQDRIIEANGVMIAKLQKDVERMTKGCGHKDCYWKHRG